MLLLQQIRKKKVWMRSCILSLLLPLLVVCRSPAALGCSSWLTDCTDGKMVMNGRTIDFGLLDITDFGEVYAVPKGHVVELTAAISADSTPTVTAQYSYAYTGVEFIPGMRPFNLDGINSAGLAFGALWQSNITFHDAYNSSEPGEAIFVFDLGDVLLANFSTVQQVRDYLSPSKVQLTTQVFDESTATGLSTLFGVDPDIPQPTDGDVFYIGIHFHVTDATGDSVLIEATDDGYKLYETKVVTNEPAWPMMEAQHKAYGLYNFSSVPGVPEKSIPPGLPLVIPFNSASDSLDTGYFGSESRNLRLMYQIENCGNYPWVDEGWSPGYTGMEPPQGLDYDTYTTLKKVENYMASIVVPRSQLVGVTNEYATLYAVIKDNTNAVYYYQIPRDNVWTALNIKDIDGQSDVVVYPIEPQNQPFFVKAVPVDAQDSSSDSGPAAGQVRSGAFSLSAIPTLMASMIYLWMTS